MRRLLGGIQQLCTLRRMNLTPQLVLLHTPPAGVVTLPDGDVLIVGGVAHNGQGGWQSLPDRRAEYDNPT